MEKIRIRVKKNISSCQHIRSIIHTMKKKLPLILWLITVMMIYFKTRSMIEEASERLGEADKLQVPANDTKPESFQLCKRLPDVIIIGVKKSGTMTLGTK